MSLYIFRIVSGLRSVIISCKIYVPYRVPKSRTVPSEASWPNCYGSYDGTNGGVSNRSDSFGLFASHLSYAQVADYCIAKSIDVNKVLKLVYREHLDYVHAEPVIDRNKHYMAGGNFIYTSDSRFKELTNVRYPVSIHDRTE